MLRTLLLFSLVYILLYYFADNPLQFDSVIDALYFSATTTSTTGFGDYAPKTPLSKLIVTLHMIVLIIDVNDILKYISFPGLKKLY